MIVVTGTKRSGTSMWMQILVAAGYPPIGDAFPSNWGEVIRSANPRGFFESKFGAGVYFQTNPDPTTGIYLSASDSEAHAVKVFAPGVVRSDIAFLKRVIVTMRPWREFTMSLYKLRSQAGAAKELDQSRAGTLALDPILEWWSDNYSLVRDFVARRYPAHFLSYQNLIEDPRGSIEPILGWLGEGSDSEAAIAAVDPELYRNRAEHIEVATPDVPPILISACDDLYECVHQGKPLEHNMIAHLNETQQAILPLLAEQRVRTRRKIAQHIMEDPS